MKMQGKKPTRAQKAFIGAHNLSPENWLVCKDTPQFMLLKSKYQEWNKKKIYKEVNGNV